MKSNEQHRSCLRRRVGSTAALGFVALLASLTLGLASAGVAAAAPAPPPAVILTSNTATLSASEATAFTQRVADLQAQARSTASPNGLGCLDSACGWTLSRTQSQTLWRNVVNKPINAVAAYCRTFLTNIGASSLTWLCDAAANLLRNLTAPNGRCLFIGAEPDIFPPFFTVVVKYTTISCV